MCRLLCPESRRGSRNSSLKRNRLAKVRGPSAPRRFRPAGVFRFAESCTANTSARVDRFRPGCPASDSAPRCSASHGRAPRRSLAGFAPGGFRCAGVVFAGVRSARWCFPTGTLQGGLRSTAGVRLAEVGFARSTLGEEFRRPRIPLRGVALRTGAVRGGSLAGLRFGSWFRSPRGFARVRSARPPRRGFWASLRVRPPLAPRGSLGIGPCSAGRTSGRPRLVGTTRRRTFPSPLLRLISRRRSGSGPTCLLPRGDWCLR